MYYGEQLIVDTFEIDSVPWDHRLEACATPIQRKLSGWRRHLAWVECSRCGCQVFSALSSKSIKIWP